MNESFKLRTPLLMTSGSVSDVDETIKSHLDELDRLLGKRIFKVVKKEDRTSCESTKVESDIKDFLGKELTPKMVLNNTWAENTLAYEFNNAQGPKDYITLSEYIDTNPDISALKYAFENNLSDKWFNLAYNAKVVLDGRYPAIRDYLIVYTFHIADIEQIDGVMNFILKNRYGAQNIANYAIVSAARTIIETDQIKVDDVNNDSNPIFTEIKDAGLSLSSTSFKTSLIARINDHILNGKYYELIETAEKKGNITLPLGIKPMLIKYIKHYPITITAKNINSFLPLFISQIMGETAISDSTEVDREESDKDFDVYYLEDDKSQIQISKSAVKCAAQLYYGMVVGDELDVFNVMNYFTHKYLIRGGIIIEDRRLRDDLQMYVFSNRFTDLITNKIEDRTRPAERQMFYRQVFNYGNAEITDDIILNREFPRLWKVLMLESAKYLERAQVSPNAENYVSRQNVMQAVEDLQYNLSTNCTGMANVITPLIYAEINFIIQRIFMHKEILRQIVPAGGTWWKVVETLYMGMKKARPKATVLYNKAKLGDNIIRSMAEYNPSTFEDDKNFSTFISNVDRFITTQSILQEALTDELKKVDTDDEDGPNGLQSNYPESANISAVSGGKDSNSEWDF